MNVNLKQIGTSAWGLYIDGRLVHTEFAPDKKAAKAQIAALLAKKVEEA